MATTAARHVTTWFTPRHPHEQTPSRSSLSNLFHSSPSSKAISPFKFLAFNQLYGPLQCLYSFSTVTEDHEPESDAQPVLPRGGDHQAI